MPGADASLPVAIAPLLPQDRIRVTSLQWNMATIIPRYIGSLSQIWDIVAELDDILAQRAGELSDGSGDVPVWYRGHARETHNLLPSLFRSRNGLGAELQLHQHYHAFKSELSGWETLFQMQYYFVPTRLLDWTTDLATALYFALNSEECTDPSIYILHPCILNYRAGRLEDPKPFLPDKSGPYRYPEDYTPRCAHKLPLAIMPAIKNPRIQAQSGMFTIHGQEPFPIEELCPEAVAKIVLRVPRAAIHQFHQLRRLGRKARDVFPDEAGMAITLKEQFGLKPIPEKIIEATLLRIWREDHENLLAGNDGKVHLQGISGCVVDASYIERAETERLENWLAQDSGPFAIVSGGAASGKTNFLVNLVLKRKLYLERPVLFLSLNAFKPGERTLIEFLADFLRANSPHQYEPIDETALQSMVCTGRVLLILDGLDELARIQGEGCVANLGVEISRLASSGTKRSKIIIACRDHIVHRLESRDILAQLGRRKKFPLKAIPAKVMKGRLSAALPNVRISGKALQILGEVPLFYGVITQAKGSRVRSGPIATKADFWRIWLDMASQSFNPPAERRQLLNDLGAVATLMLKERDDYLPESELAKQPALGTLIESLASRGPGRCPVFVKEANGKWRFIHQAIREYVLASNIHLGLDNPAGDSVLTATSSLDYESAETYIYLQDLLPNRHIATAHLPDLKGMKPFNWNHFARNYFEALGMLGADSEHERRRAIDQALKTIQAGAPVKYKTKYNAARCLARLHPTSPRVYCEWATRATWPEIASGKNLVVWGWAVRGFHQRELKLGKSPPEALLKKPAYDALSRRACQILLDVITDLAEIPELHREGEFLEVNCAHALIRWLDPTSLKLVQQAEKLMRSEKLVREARMNLFLALCVNGRRPRGASDVLVRKKFRKHFDGDLDRLDKLCGLKKE